MSLLLSPVFSNGMVLQRDINLKIYGNALAGETVKIEFCKNTYTASANNDGIWEVMCGSFDFGGPYEMIISTDFEKITIKDILIGDVWLCSGQSNMELMMNRIKLMYPEEFEEKITNIRQFKVPQIYNFDAPVCDVCGGFWETAANSLENFTAVGYFFAKRLYKKYGVPIGLLASAVGGTPIHAWMSEEMLADFPETLKILEKCREASYVENTINSDNENMNKHFTKLYHDDLGFKENWNAADFDDSGWEERELLDSWDDLSKCGSIWLRKTIDLPKEFENKPADVFFGTLVDSDNFYINGIEFGNTGYCYPPRFYHIDRLPEGKCVISIRLVINGGAGMITPDKTRVLVCEGKAINLDGLWKFKRGAYSDKLPSQTFFNYTPSGLYNGMIYPLRNFAVKGVIWYQGESDANELDIQFEHSIMRYNDKFTIMVDAWRKLWGYDFPFLFTQLAYYGHANTKAWHIMRNEQMKGLNIPKTGMAVALDAGEYNDIHPFAKQTVGDRLARVAQRVAYGEVLPNSPFELISKS